MNARTMVEYFGILFTLNSKQGISDLPEKSNFKFGYFLMKFIFFLAKNKMFKYLHIIQQKSVTDMSSIIEVYQLHYRKVSKIHRPQKYADLNNRPRF